MKISLSNPTYASAIRVIAKELPIDAGSFLITGATGLIGSCMVDTLLFANANLDADFTIYALGRSASKLEARFGTADKRLHFIEQDIMIPLPEELNPDYIIHAASNADPKTYATQPAETLLTNVKGTENILHLAAKVPGCRLLYTSTFEVYGEIQNQAVYRENDYGTIDCSRIRSVYPESKRSAELLVRCYEQEFGVQAVIARLSSVYGPTMLSNDSKAHAQFIRNGLAGENIVLKSKGLIRRTYCYVMDAVSAIFHLLFCGTPGEIYNVSNENSIASIAEVAGTVAELCGTDVVFDLPDEIESKGFSKPVHCILDNEKLRATGWNGKYMLKDGMEETLRILKA